MFTMGMSQPSHSEKDKGDKTIGEGRVHEMKGDKSRDMKNERTKYGVDLRKKKRYVHVFCETVFGRSSTNRL